MKIVRFARSRFAGWLVSLRLPFGIFIALLLTISSPPIASGGTPNVAPSPPEMKNGQLHIDDHMVRAGLLFDMNSLRIVWQKQKDAPVPIASLTKMMVGLIVMEEIRVGRLTWQTQVRVTPEAAAVEGSRIDLEKGQTLSVEDLLKAALIASGNDATYLLAQVIGGSEAAFVSRMNRRAARMVMNTTRFSNATGLPASDPQADNHASALDLLILAHEFIRYPELLRIAAMDRAVIHQGARLKILSNHNRLVGRIAEVDGLKTGYTRNAGYCLTATAVKGNLRVIAIALGVKKPALRNRFVAQLMDQYYQTRGLGPLTQPEIAKIAHRIRKGETLYAIARKYRCTINELRKWNRLDGNLIRAGTCLTVLDTGKRRGISIP